MRQAAEEHREEHRAGGKAAELVEPTLRVEAWDEDVGCGPARSAAHLSVSS